jgi:hypothetical protein
MNIIKKDLWNLNKFYSSALPLYLHHKMHYMLPSQTKKSNILEL